jgi:hypothetical protein
MSDSYCPGCDRTLPEPETTLNGPVRVCLTCGNTVRPIPARRATHHQRLQMLERQLETTRPLMEALATMPFTHIHGIEVPCPWCRRKGTHDTDCWVMVARAWLQKHWGARQSFAGVASGEREA